MLRAAAAWVQEHNALRAALTQRPQPLRGGRKHRKQSNDCFDTKVGPDEFDDEGFDEDGFSRFCMCGCCDRCRDMDGDM